MVCRTPSYRLHKPSGLAVVTLSGKDHYLGTHGSPESRTEYDHLVAEWLARGRGAVRKEATTPADPTVAELLLAYWRYAERHYRTPSGEPGPELDNLRDAFRPLRKLYGHTPAAAFGPLALRAVRDAMVEQGLARTTVNARIKRIRRAFKWAVGVELIPPSVHQALQAVEGLQRGRTEAPEPDPVGPVPIGRVEATLPHLSPAVAALVKLQVLTGCRVGEVLVMRGRDLTPGEPTWDYRPASHKNAWRGKGRVIALVVHPASDLQTIWAVTRREEHPCPPR
jgi:integrase